MWSWLGNMIGDSVQAQLQAPKGQRVERYCTIQVNDNEFPINACDFLLRHETPRYAMIRYTTTRKQEGKCRNPQIRFFDCSSASQPCGAREAHQKWTGLNMFHMPRRSLFIQVPAQLDPSASQTHCSAEILATLHMSLRHLDFKLRRCRPWAPLGAG